MRGLSRTVALLVVLGIAASTARLELAAAQDKQAKDKKDSAVQKDKQAKDKVKAGAASAATFEIYKDKGGKFRFRFMDSEGTELAMSPRGYAEKPDIQKAIDTIKREAARARVEEEK
jgi:uncharacterized protein YegP (UPF0339 family)